MTLTNVLCKYFDKPSGRCNHADRRWFFGRYRLPCSFGSSHGELCRLREIPAPRVVDFVDATVHGQCVDTDGNEWEVSAVTSTDVVVAVRGTDGRSSQTHIPKDPFLRRLAEAAQADVNNDR